MLIDGKRGGITTDDLLQFAETHGIQKREAQEILDRTSSVLANWPDYAAAVKLGPAITHTVHKRLAG